MNDDVKQKLQNNKIQNIQNQRSKQNIGNNKISSLSKPEQLINNQSNKVNNRNSLGGFKGNNSNVNSQSKVNETNNGAEDKQSRSSNSKPLNTKIGNDITKDSSTGGTVKLPNLFGKKKFFTVSFALPIISFFIIFIAAGFMFIITVDPTTPFKAFAQLVLGTGDKFLNTLAGCGWATDEECEAKKRNNYLTQTKQQVEYYRNYSIELDTGLILATLTYEDPYIYDEDDSNPNGLKKDEATVNALVQNMMEHTGDRCLIIDQVGLSEEFPCEEKETKEEELKDNEEGKTIVERPIYQLTPDKYRQELEGFVIKYFLDGEITDENKEKAKEIIEEIYENAKLYDSILEEEMNASQANANIYVNNEVMVTLTDCTGNIILEEVTLTDYLKGVLYANGTSETDDYLKFLAMVAKNYLYSQNNANIEFMPQNLRIRNCEANQLYCSVQKGCYYDANQTLNSGSGDGYYFKPPLTDNVEVNKIENAVNTTKNQFLINNNTIVSANISGIDKTEIKNQLYNDSYETVLVSTFGGTISEVDLYTKGYPLDLKNNYVTSHYGWRYDPVRFQCLHHNGTDISGTIGDNIYAISDGVVLTNAYSASYGYYTILGHGNLNSTTGTYDYYSLYAHQYQLSPHVIVGGNVLTGQLIGRVGSTGWSTGPHLHIEIYSYVNGTKVGMDPILYFKNVELTGLVGGPLYESFEACNAVHH